ncbi:uncharacterized protein LOC108031232 [Drosophila biarmipes]|uniref:uncharacterized protein LOC108031232 n=1 Tax=Drosophila biarmipes TaxID=125945 RepID=UPI0007E62B3B|nr:uncharacterized protein LOC108031232 [Drosophila biarmipes]
MPLDQVIISYRRSRNFINVLLLRSMNLFQPVLGESPSEKLIVSANGICWREQNLEYRILVNDFFDIATRNEDGEVPFNLVEKEGNNLAFGLALRRIPHRALDERTVSVDKGELLLRINPFTRCSLHCGNCANKVVGERQYLQIREIPMTTMMPQNYFCARNKLPVYPTEEELFYGLNYLVVSTDLLGIGVTTTEGHRCIQCSRCQQPVGEYLGRDVAAQLFADALRLVTTESPFEFKEIFGHITPTQMMIRLLHDAYPISMEKTRLLLKTVRPDGQLQYLYLQVDTKQLHILRSELDTSDLEMNSTAQLPMEDDTSSESDLDMVLSDTSSSSINPQTGDDLMDRSDPLPKPEAAEPQKSVKYLNLRGFGGFRLKYLFSASDEELNESDNVTSSWCDQGSRMIRISYSMMVDLMTEFNAHERVAAALEMNSPPTKSRQPRLTYVIFEPDEEFYARQEQFAKIDQ